MPIPRLELAVCLVVDSAESKKPLSLTAGGCCHAASGAAADVSRLFKEIQLIYLTLEAVVVGIVQSQ
jgi:hypothetical protein